MSFLGKLLSSVSSGTLCSAAAAEVDARTGNDRIFGLRSTPRRPERHPGFKAASPRRAKRRREARTVYLHRLAREQAIGVNPKYLNGPRDRNALRVGDWLREAIAWNKAHPVKADG